MNNYGIYLRLDTKERFNELIKLVKDLGERHFLSRQIMPKYIITITKSFLTHEPTVLGSVFSQRIEVGEKFLYIVGDELSLRCPEDIFDMYTIKGMKIFRLTNFPIDMIFNQTIATIEDFKFS